MKLKLFILTVAVALAFSIAGQPRAFGDGSVFYRMDADIVAANIPSNPASPDTDGDGVSDDIDQCDNLAGTAENHGCPPLREDCKILLGYFERSIETFPEDQREGLLNLDPTTIRELPDAIEFYLSTRVVNPSFTIDWCSLINNVDNDSVPNGYEIPVCVVMRGSDSPMSSGCPCYLLGNSRISHDDAMDIFSRDSDAIPEGLSSYPLDSDCDNISDANESRECIYTPGVASSVATENGCPAEYIITSEEELEDVVEATDGLYTEAELERAIERAIRDRGLITPEELEDEIEAAIDGLYTDEEVEREVDEAVTPVQGELDTAVAERDRLQGEVDSAAIELEEARAAVLAAQGDVTTAMADAQSRLDAAESNYQTKIAELEASIKALEDASVETDPDVSESAEGDGGGGCSMTGSSPSSALSFIIFLFSALPLAIRRRK